MNKFILVLTIAAAGLSILAGSEIRPPEAQQKPKILTANGDSRQDPYFWLNERDTPEVLAYLQAENEYTDHVMKSTEPLQEELFSEIIGHISPDDATVPYLYNGYLYSAEFKENLEYPILKREPEKLRFLRKKEVILDINQLAEGLPYCDVDNVNVSPDNRLLLFAIDEVGRRVYKLRVKNLKTGRFLPDEIPNTTGATVWANDNQTFFYTVKDSTLRAHKVFRHIMGSDPSQDVEVYHETDNTFYVDLAVSKSGDYIFINSGSTISDEVRFIHADRPLDSFRIIEPRKPDFKYRVWQHGADFYILSNDTGHNYRLVKSDTAHPGQAHWETVIPHSEDVYLQKLDVFSDYIIISQRRDGLQQLKTMSLQDGSSYLIPFDDAVYSVYTIDNFVMDTHWLRFSYSSMNIPHSVFDFNLKHKTRKLKKQDQVLGDFNPDNYITEQHFATADDGTRIPISLVRSKNFPLTHKTPTLLYAYGAYGYPSDPSFRIQRLPLLDRGWVFAIAHVRGGTELGYGWYEDGKLLNKKNSFTDFIDCAEHLIQIGYTDENYLYGLGGSAGGLLIGAVANMRPDLFRGLVAEVPWVDVITTMLDESIPLTTGEYNEWGNPNDKTYYDYMLSYSPYDNVRAMDYPAMLITTGYNDSQVQYWEPAKWTARLRERKTDSNTLIFKCDMESGHGGASGRFEKYRDYALVYAFMINELPAD